MNSNPVDATVEALRVTLGRASRRAEVAASNLANVDTPGYRSLAVEFDDLLSPRAELEPRLTHPFHRSRSADRRVRGTLLEAPVTRMRNDGNSVDLDREMTTLGMTQGRYRTAAELLRKRFALLVYTATDGRAGV